MEDKNPSDEDVKIKEELEKVKELEKNKTIALQQEREEKKALADKLAQYEAKEKEVLENKKKEEGQFQELLTQKESELKAKQEEIITLSEKASAYDKLLAEIQEKETNQLNELMGKVPKDILEKNSFILEDLKNDKKIKFLETLLPKAEEKKDFENKGKGKPPADVDEYDLLKQKVSSGKATPAERGKYLQLLRSKK